MELADVLSARRPTCAAYGFANPRAWTGSICENLDLTFSFGFLPPQKEGKAHIADAVNATTSPLGEAPRGYADFDAGAATKFVLELHEDVVARRCRRLDLRAKCRGAIPGCHCAPA